MHKIVLIGTLLHLLSACNPVMTKSVAKMRLISTLDRLQPVIQKRCVKILAANRCNFQIIWDENPRAFPNAFLLEDEQGHPVIIITDALLNTVLNEDELAFVIAHEASHHLLQHLEQNRLNAEKGVSSILQAAHRYGIQIPQNRSVLEKIGAQVGVRVYAKQFELEADTFATELTSEAGFDPVLGAQFFFRLPDPGNNFLGTHPSNIERLQNIYRLTDKPL